MNKKVVAIAAVIIIALLAGFTIGYAVRSNVRNKQIYEKFNLTNNTTNQVKNAETEDENEVIPGAAEIEVLE